MNKLGKRFLSAIVVAALTAATLALTASGGASDAGPGATLTSTGTGSVSLTPDSATVDFGASVSRRTAEQASSAAAALATSILDALRSGGATSITTNSVSLNVRYAQGSGEIVGFDASDSIAASVSVNAAGRLIDAAIAAGANNVYGPWFTSSQDQEASYQSALRAATNQARQRAAAIASAAGVSLGRVVSINPLSGGAIASVVPTAAATPASASAPTPVLPPTQQVSASVTIVYEIN